MQTQFNLSQHYKARIVQAGGNPNERLLLPSGVAVPRYTISDCGRIWDSKTDTYILGTYEENPTEGLLLTYQIKRNNRTVAYRKTFKSALKRFENECSRTQRYGMEGDSISLQRADGKLLYLRHLKSNGELIY